MDRKVCKEVVLKLYNAMVLPLLLYGCETWTLRADQKKGTEAAEKRFLSCVAGCTLLHRKRSEEI
jgi:hypothetical protein